MKTSHYEKTKQELEKRNSKNVETRNDALRRVDIIEKNKFEKRVFPIVAVALPCIILLSILFVLLGGSHVISINPGTNYLLPLLNILSVDVLPAISLGLSLGLGKIVSFIIEKITKNKKKFKEISKAKNDKQKTEEIAKYKTLALQSAFKYRIINRVLNKLEDKRHEFDSLNEKYDKNNIFVPQTKEKTLMNIQELEKELNEKYEKLNNIATKRTLHEMFYEIRFFSNRFEKLFNDATINWFFGLFTILLPFAALNYIVPLSANASSIYGFIIGFPGLIGSYIYSIKKNRSQLKVFKKINQSLHEDALHNKPYKNEKNEISTIFKDYEKLEDEICLLELQLAEQKRIKDIYDGYDNDSHELDKTYSDNLNDTKLPPVMTFTDSEIPIENNKQQVLIKK